jgi:hypothetical protein
MFCTTLVHAAVTISTSVTQNMICESGVCTPTAANAVLNVGDLTTMLAGGNVTVNTGTGSLAQQVQDIVVAGSFNWANASSLTLDAYRSVTVEQPIADNGTAAVSLVTNDGGSGGTLSFISGGSLSFLSPANSLSINGHVYTLASSVSALASDIAHKPSGYYALSASYNASHDGTYRHSPIRYGFKGIFNGLGNAISNLTIDGGKKSQYLGLFAYVDTPGVIDSILVTDANISVGRTNAGPGMGILAGVSQGTVFNSFASGEVTGKALNSEIVLGGLVGGNLGEVLDSAADATIIGSARGLQSTIYTGGLVGASQGLIENSYANGSISAGGKPFLAQAGGLLGWIGDGGVVENCYATGTVTTGQSSEAGGLVGQTDVAITDSYSTGAVTVSGSSTVGGLVGYDGSNGDLSSDYWDITTSGITNLSQGAGNISNDPGITGQTTAQLQSGLPAGFDPAIWAESPSINNGLPYLIANPPQ